MMLIKGSSAVLDMYKACKCNKTEVVDIEVEVKQSINGRWGSCLIKGRPL